MTTIQVTKHTREKIREYAKDESVNDTIVRLLDESEPFLQDTDTDTTKTNIEVDESTFNRLKQYKLSPSESHSDTILRLILSNSDRMH